MADNDGHKIKYCMEDYILVLITAIKLNTDNYDSHEIKWSTHDSVIGTAYCIKKDQELSSMYNNN
jgi:hypothetical protein